MAYTLLNIIELDTYDSKFFHLIKYIKNNIDNYKLFGLYPISKEQPMTYEYLCQLQDTYIDSNTRVLSNDLEDSTFYEQHFQLLKELIQNDLHTTNKIRIPEKWIEGMDSHNKEIAQEWNKKGPEAAVDIMTQEIRKGNMSYSQMRYLYG